MRFCLKIGSSLTALFLSFGCVFFSTSAFGSASHEKGGIVMNRPLIPYEYKPGELTRLCGEAIQKAKQRLDEIANIPKDQRTARNSLLAFEEALGDYVDTILPLTFMSYVSTDAAISKEASECEQTTSQFSVSVFTRRDLYNSIKDFKNLIPARARLHDELVKSFEENGLKLPDEQLQEVRTLKQHLAQLESQFSTNLNQDQTTVEFNQEDLDGVPEDYVKSLKKTSTGMFIVGTKEPDYVRIMENARRSETRKKMQVAYENRATENTKLLEEAILLRQKIASLLGFKTWFDYRTQSRMAKNGQTVHEFLIGLKDKLALRNKEDLGKLFNLKKEMDSSSAELNSWDIRYFANQLKKKEYSLDNEVIRQYFPSTLVVDGLFKVYSTLLGVEFVEEKEAKVWAEGVKLFKIKNASDHHLIGYFYADFFPRALKYGHAAAFPLVSGRLLPNGEYSHPVAAIVANFSAPENGKPSLLKHEEVETLFHEFGHIMHQTLTRAPFASLSGSSVDQDFVEAPSQMLENWVYSPEVLNLVSGHYQDNAKKLPEELLKKLLAARDFNQGYFYTRQLHFALLDYTYHTSHGPVNSAQIYADLHKELVGLDAAPNSHFPASFGHLMGGYDAGYYGYLWSEVYAEDMFTRFEKAGLMNSKVGAEYRSIILESGKMKDAMKLLETFLGRKPNTEAFYKRLHIGK